MRYEVAVSISPAINWTNGHIGIAIFSLQHKEAIVIAVVCIINEDWPGALELPRVRLIFSQTSAYFS